ncbi:MAG: hypothetical protein IJL87_01550, partial [Clostridia bacterium]|nr:hypothetical protein [Clostridia bacterium]
MSNLLKKAVAILLCALLCVSCVTAFAETQSVQTSSTSQSSITANSMLNADGSITLSGTANIWGWIEKVVVLKGDRTADAAAAYNSGDVIAQAAVSNTMNYNYSFTLTSENVTTDGYTVIAATSGASAWAAAYVASPAGTIEGEGGSGGSGEGGEGGQTGDDTAFGPGTISGTCT